MDLDEESKYLVCFVADVCYVAVPAHVVLDGNANVFYIGYWFEDVTM